MHRNQQNALLAAKQQASIVSAKLLSIKTDPEVVKSDRRKRAALFLDKMKKEGVAGELIELCHQKVFWILTSCMMNYSASGINEAADEEGDAESGSTTTTSSLAPKSKSLSPDDVEIIEPASRGSKERSPRCELFLFWSI